MNYRICSIIRHYSIKRKLMVFFLFLSSVGILVTSVAFLLNQLYRYNQSAREEIRAQASILAKNTSAALTFSDLAAANEILSGVKANPRIVAVALFNSDNNLFAYYVVSGADSTRLRNEFTSLIKSPADSKVLFAALQKASASFQFLEMHPLVSEPVTLDNQQVGTIIIQTDLHYLYRELKFLAVLMLCVALTTLLIAWLLATRFQQIISDPIISLSDIMKRVSSEKNYALRAVSDSPDEIGTLIAGFNEMLQEIQNRDRIVFEQQQQLLDEKNSRIRKLTVAVEQSANSIVIASPQGDIEYVNPYFCALTGYTADEAIGQNPRILNAEPGSSDKYRVLWETVLGGGRWTGEFLNRKKNGELFWEQATISPVLDEQGAITSLIAVKVDITALKYAEAEMRQAKELAEAASLAKSDFLANMSHEIRTPMNGVMGMTDLLLQGALTPEKEKLYLHAIKDSADSLMLIINDILDFSKIEAGKFTLEKIPFSLRDTVERCMSGLMVRAEEKGLTIVHRVDTEVPTCLIGDPGRLRQVLTNLVGNALKFCQQGDIAVDVELVSIEGDEVLVHVCVRDTGIGIAEEACQRIFNQFEQADSSTTRKFGGTGLGLAISKKLVELMDGKIWVESKLGVGSCFHFTACYALGNEEQLKDKETASALSQPRQAPLDILVADDVEINRALVQAILEPYGHRITFAENGLKALEAYESNLFDIVLMDIQMPEMDGLQATQAIREYERTICRSNPVPIVAMTAFAGNEDRQICLDAGMDDYLAKPIKPAQLLNLLHKYCDHSVERIEAVAAEDQPATVQKVVVEEECKEAIAIFAQNELLERLGGRAELIPRFVELFCKGAVPELEGLSTALAAADVDGVRRHAHAIKGSSGNIAAQRMHQTAVLIEKAAKEGDLAEAPDLLARLQQEYREFVEAIGVLLS